MCEFKEADSKAFFHKLVDQFVNRRLGNTWEFAIHRIHVFRQQLYATPSRRAWVPQEFKNKFFKELINH
jgi:hypothetical protein